MTESKWRRKVDYSPHCQAVISSEICQWDYYVLLCHETRLMAPVPFFGGPLVEPCFSQNRSHVALIASNRPKCCMIFLISLDAAVRRSEPDTFRLNLLHGYCELASPIRPIRQIVSK